MLNILIFLHLNYSQCILPQWESRNCQTGSCSSIHIKSWKFAFVMNNIFVFYFYKWRSSPAIVIFLLLCEEIHSSNWILVLLPYTFCKIFISAFVPLINLYHQWSIFTGEFPSAYEHAPGVPKQNGKQTPPAPTFSQTHTLATTPFLYSLFTRKKNALSTSSFVLDPFLKPF